MAGGCLAATRQAMEDDGQLPQRYAGDRAESAFGELVARRIDLVYSATLRAVNGGGACPPTSAMEMSLSVLLTSALAVGLEAEEAGRGGSKFALFLPCPGQPASSRRNPHQSEETPSSDTAGPTGKPRSHVLVREQDTRQARSRAGMHLGHECGLLIRGTHEAARGGLLGDLCGRGRPRPDEIGRCKGRMDRRSTGSHR